MENDFNISLRSFGTKEEAEELSRVLAENNIVSKITKDSGNLDYVFQGESPTNKFEVLVEENDHQKAENILLDLARKDLEAVDSDYYLFSFSDDELKEILVKKNEWSEFDVLLSEKILLDRGVEVNLNEIKELQSKHDRELEKPESGQTGWIIVGYCFSLMGGFIGILIGYSLWLSKKKLPNGYKVPAYNDKIRNHGKTIFYIGVLMFALVFLVRLLIMFEIILI